MLAIITFKLGKVTDFKVFFPAVVTLHNRYKSNVEKKKIIIIIIIIIIIKIKKE